MVVVGVEDDLQIVRTDVGVPAGEPGVHAPRTGVFEHPRADVQRCAVEHEPHLGALRRRLPFMRLILAEVRRGGCGAPDRFIELAVEVDLALQLNRARLRPRRRMNVLGY